MILHFSLTVIGQTDKELLSVINLGVDDAWMDNIKVNKFEVFNGKLIAGGNFKSINGIPCNNVAILENGKFRQLGNGLKVKLNDLRLYKQELYAANDKSQLHKWNGREWQTWNDGKWISESKVDWREPSFFNTPHGNLSLCIKTLAVYNDLLFAGGEPGIRGMITTPLTFWNGTTWRVLNDENEGTKNIISKYVNKIHSLSTFQGNLIIAGEAGGKPVLLKWNGSLIENLSTSITDIKSFGIRPEMIEFNNNLYISHDNGIVKYDGNKFSVIMTGGQQCIFRMGLYNQRLYFTTNNFNQSGTQVGFWDGNSIIYKFIPISPYSSLTEFENYFYAGITSPEASVNIVDNSVVKKDNANENVKQREVSTQNKTATVKSEQNEQSDEFIGKSILKSKILSKLTATEKDLYQKAMKMNPDPQRKMFQVCGSGIKKCSWCGRNFQFNKTYTSSIFNFQATANLDYVESLYIGFEGLYKTAGVKDPEGKFVNEMASYIRDEIKKISQGKVYSCVGKGPLYCSKRCEARL